MNELKYYNAGSPIRNSPKESYKEDFTEIYNSLVDNAPNVFNDVEVEQTYGKKDFIKTRARIDSVINPSTGEKWGEDYKYFIFDPDDTATYIGRLIKWHDNYWLVINCNTYESITNGCVARRCNNMLRWIDEYGNKIEEPCSINYDIMEGGDYAGKDTTTISGFERFYCQKNNNTIKIKANQRFLFGVKENPICYRVYSDGMRNFMNTKTEDNYSPSVLEFWMGANYLNPDTDDFENLIADAYINQCTITIEQDLIVENIGYKTKLIAIVKKNNKIIDLPVKWESSNNEICSIDEYGNIECLAIGDVIITAYIDENKTVQDRLNITITDNATNEYDIRINPVNYKSNDFIYQGDTVVYECYLYKDNVIQNNEFIFTVNTNVNDKNYKFEILNGNSFKIQNIKKSSELLDIICQTDNMVKELALTLRGAF